MGQGPSQKLEHCRPAYVVRGFTQWTLSDISKLASSLKQLNLGHGIVKSQFNTWLTLDHIKRVSEDKINKIFELLDTDHNGRVDSLEFLSGLTMLTHRASFDEKVQFCFELYDFNINGSLTPYEMTLMMRSTIQGMFKLVEYSETELSDAEFESLTRMAFRIYDKDHNNSIDYQEFTSWANGNRAVMQYIDLFTKESNHLVIDSSDDSAVELSDEELSGIEDFEEIYNHKIVTKRAKKDASASDLAKLDFKEPSHWIKGVDQDTVPEASLALDWVHGYSCRDGRDNIAYLGNDDCIVYPTASLVVVMDIKRNTQRLYTSHTSKVTSLAVHPDGNIVASAQLSPAPREEEEVDSSNSIHIWNSRLSPPQTVAILSSFHNHGVGLLKFSPDGVYLASVGLDADHSIAVWEWQSSTLVASCKGDAAPILSLTWSPDSQTLVVTGKKLINFLTLSPTVGGGLSGKGGGMMRRRRLDVKRAHLGHAGCLQTFTCSSYLANSLVVGTANGELYHFKNGRRLSKVIKAHMEKTPVTVLKEWSGGLCSCGKDGMVKLWDMALISFGEQLDIDVGSFDTRLSGAVDCGVVGCCVDKRGEQLVVSSRNGDIFQVTLETGRGLRLLSSHFAGETKGLAVNPTRNHYATCGDDKTVRVWSTENHRLTSLARLTAPCRSLTYSNDGNQLAVGCSDGSIVVFNANNLEQVFATLNSALHIENDSFIASSMQNSIEVLSYSPDSKMLAAGSYQGCIYLYDLFNAPGSNSVSYSCGKICKHSSPSSIINLDWSIDSKFIQSVTVDDDLLFWDNGGNLIDHSSLVRDIAWSSWSSRVGWCVAGVCNDVSSVARSSSQAVLAVGGRAGQVELYRYPCVGPNSSSKVYSGHAAAVSDMRFLANDSGLITVGGSDNTVIQWRYTHDQVESKDTPLSAEYDSDVEEELQFCRYHPTEQMVAKAGHWKANCVPPANCKYVEEIEAMGLTRQAADADLEVSWVLGFNSSMRNNLYCVDDLVVYAASSFGVSLNLNARPTPKQQYVSHSDFVACLTCNKLGSDPTLVASADVDNTLVVWDAESGNVHVTIDANASADVSAGRPVCLAFSPNSELLAFVTNDSNNTVQVFNWKQSRLVASSPGGNDAFLDAVWTSDREFVTVGVNRVTFWSISQNRTTAEMSRGVFGNLRLHDNLATQAYMQTAVCVCFLNHEKDVSTAWDRHGSKSDPSKYVATGMVDGSIYVWNADTKRLVNMVPRAHASTVNCLVYDRRNRSVVSAGRDGVVKEWPVNDLIYNTRRLVEGVLLSNVAADRIPRVDGQTKETKNNESPLSDMEAVSIKALDIRAPTASSGAVLLVGLASNEILQISLERGKASVDASLSAEEEKVRVVMQAHSQDGLYGLAVHPTRDQFLTTGDDALLLLHDVSTQRILARAHLSAAGRCVGISPNGFEVVVGLVTGEAQVFKLEELYENGTTSSMLVPNTTSGKANKYSQQQAKQVQGNSDAGAIKEHRLVAGVKLGDAGEWIQTACFAPDGLLLALGGQDGKIYVYEVPSYKLVGVLMGHASFVTHLDWSYKTDKNYQVYLRSNDGDDELLFWNINSLSQIKSATAVKDVDWATNTCSLSWATQAMHGGDDVITCCARSNGCTALVGGTASGRVQLLPFPCATQQAANSVKTFAGHASGVYAVDFTAGDRYVVSVSCDDKTVIVWRTDELEDVYKGRLEWLTMSEHEQKRRKLAASNDRLAVDKRPDEQQRLDLDEELSLQIGKRFALPTANCDAEWNHDLQFKLRLKEPCYLREYTAVNRKVSRSLKLDWVYGFRSVGYQNVHYTSSDDVLFTAGSTAVIQSGLVKSSNQPVAQRFHIDHTGEISCCTVSSDGQTAATAGLFNGKPTIQLWDVESATTHLSIVTSHAVGLMRFNAENTMLAVVTLDPDHTLVVYSLASQGKLLAKVKSSKLDVTCLLFQTPDSLVVNGASGMAGGNAVGSFSIVTGGVNHVKFWSLDLAKSRLTAKSGSFAKLRSYRQSGAPTAFDTVVVTCVALFHDRVVCGTSAGQLLVWLNGNISNCIQAHHGALSSMSVTNDESHLVTGGADRRLCYFNANLLLDREYFLDLEAVAEEEQFEIRSLSMSLKHHNQLVVALSNGLVLEGQLGYDDSIRWLLVTSGHSCEAAQRFISSAVFPNEQLVVSVADDKVVRLTNLYSHKMVTSLTLEVTPTCVAVSPCGNHIVVGTATGKLAVCSSDLSDQVTSVKSCCKDMVSALSFSPDGQTLAVGCSDGGVYLVETRYYAIKCVLSAHRGAVTHLDWSVDSRYLQSNSAPGKELCTLDSLSGAKVSGCEATWSSYTCVLGYDNQGIWNGSDFVSSCCRSNDVGKNRYKLNATYTASLDKQIMATANHLGQVKLVNYPCLHVDSDSKEYNDVGSLISTVSFTCEDRYVIATGADNLCLFQYKLSN